MQPAPPSQIPGRRNQFEFGTEAESNISRLERLKNGYRHVQTFTDRKLVLGNSIKDMGRLGLGAGFRYLQGRWIMCGKCLHITGSLKNSDRTGPVTGLNSP